MPETDAITVITLETPALGDRSYMVHDGEVAFVVDPQRDIDRVLALLNAHHLRLTHVFESHIHNDYVTGGFALARRAGAAYLVNADDAVSFKRVPVRDGEDFQIGPRMRVTAIATPGHTFTHLSYLLTDAGTGERTAVFSGGSLLYGATGRPDLPRPPAHRRPRAGAARLGPQASASCCPMPRRCSPPTGSGPSAPRRSPRRPARPSGRRRPPTRCSPRTRRPTPVSCWPG